MQHSYHGLELLLIAVNMPLSFQKHDIALKYISLNYIISIFKVYFPFTRDI